VHSFPGASPKAVVIRAQGIEREKNGKIPQRKTHPLIKGRVNYPRATLRMNIEILPFT
jgi:hypothetical protein